jgi:hypothetical protein
MFMKHSRYYPYERNNYFYGKLLTVRDFETEQKYFNDKRRLLNRLMYGSGVISGLQVVAIDDKSVSVEMGVALDNLGREIVVSSPVTLKLSMIEGFSNNEYAKNVYLCIAYDEKGKEPVHSVAGSSVRAEEVSEYNRVLESYRLFIKEDAPSPSSFDAAQLIEDTCILYQDNQVRIWQKSPKYVNPEDVFEVSLIIEKSLQAGKISFEYELETELFDPTNGTDTNKITFIEPANSQDTEFESKYWLKTKTNIEANAKITIKPGTAKLTIGNRHIDVNVHTANAVEVIFGSVPQKIMDDYYNRTLDQSLATTPDACIHLAKISLLQMGPTYVIEQVEQAPFNEYIYNTSLLYKLGMMNKQEGSATHFVAKSSTYDMLPDATPKLSVNYSAEKGELDFKLGLPKHVAMTDEIKTGVYELALSAKLGMNLFNKSDKRYFTDEITHGLGTGAAFIVVGIEQNNNSNGRDLDLQHDVIIMGNQEVFNDSPFESKYSGVTLGTALYPDKGTFRIGLMVPTTVEASKIKLRWWAYKKNSMIANLVNEVDDEFSEAEEQTAAAENKIE